MLKRSASFSDYGAIERNISKPVHQGASLVAVYQVLSQTETSSDSAPNHERDNDVNDHSNQSSHCSKYGCILFGLSGLVTFLWACSGMPPYPSPSHLYGMIGGFTAAGTGTISASICHCADQHKNNIEKEPEQHHSPRV